jgi:hypothetical protein
MSDIKPSEFAIDGRVLVLRFCAKDGSSGYGFRYPTTVGEAATCPDWDPKPNCGNGLHGWPWGLSMGDGKDPEWDALWQVYSVATADIVDLKGKVKFREGLLKFSGDWQGAANYCLPGQIKYIEASASGAASATGWRGAASATGASGAASATGARGAASATGARGAAISNGEYSTVEVGKDGIAASTASTVTWIARPGSVFVQSGVGWYICVSALELGAADGERITFKDGVITNREA